MFGILNLNKPAGRTSRDVVNLVQRSPGRIKAGHAGTLDPLATGVLVVCLGPATRLIPYIQQMQKTYEATFLLGQRSPSDDVETTVERLPDALPPTREAIQAALSRFLGEIWQRPPAYSAKKVGGRRAYVLARAGEAVLLPPSRVRVDGLSILDYAYPELRLQIQCGGGVYVRSLGRDLAEAVGTSAVMTALERTAVGCYSIDEATSIDLLDRSSLADLLLPPRTAMNDVPKLSFSATQLEHLRHGRQVDDLDGPAGEYAAVDPDGQLAAIVQRDGDGLVRPTRNFPSAT